MLSFLTIKYVTQCFPTYLNIKSSAGSSKKYNIIFAKLLIHHVIQYDSKQQLYKLIYSILDNESDDHGNGDLQELEDKFVSDSDTESDEQKIAHNLQNLNLLRSITTKIPFEYLI